MSVVFRHCDAFHWMVKKLANNTFANLLFGRFCHNIKITLPLFQEPSHSLQQLFDGNDVVAKEQFV
jgi:uncharacterized membrane protein